MPRIPPARLLPAQCPYCSLVHCSIVPGGGWGGGASCYHPGVIIDVHHVGIAVRSLEGALGLLRDALGLPVVKQGDVPARGARVAMLGVGGSFLEIIEPMGEGSLFAAHVEERGEGLHHLALRTDAIDAEVARLREAGVPLTDEEPRPGFTGRLSYLALEAFEGAQVEVIEPEPAFEDGPGPAGQIKRIDHVVLRVPDVTAACERFEGPLGVPVKRTFERGQTQFAFLRPGDVVIEIIGPKSGGEPGSGRIAGLAFEVIGIDELAASLKAMGAPVGEVHPALQGGRIVSVHHSGAMGVPLAFIDFG
jgi:methylmalonyl-CoA/ethylmalonyl-CoA epimerase